ncbi:endonuclease/exonuclease/phosphatase family protein [Dysgonomonas sp. Marseille-P4677]|uniref:endonuclease/exonuclease/phosphatase family protein n=1 Tax=Dysgonomonas sp. Marseille-P4677 TaxID=2364790 RepID=UPI001914BD8A|nr:endonuclease/exonuclease/phosphatase family protein [Dysgonomonas sp. Marseille-P4677]MBK5720003.1 endonuclease/exonuclease/phosphatase family protein [Dysgonomonas sp. Marseille-P4677]
MKKTFNFRIYILIIFSFLAINLLAQDKVQLKVLCYNLRFGELASLEEFADFIKKENPDIVALQEVDVNTSRTRAPHQNGKNFISELAFRTGMLSLYARTIDYAGGYYGIGILSKYPFSQSQRLFLPMPDGAKERRALLISEVELSDEESITFACTHLDYTTSDVRKTQVDFINQQLMKIKTPMILCGDFNARPDSDEIANGMKNWMQVSSPDHTIPANNPKSKIDYIFCYPSSNVWKIVNSYTPVTQLSDHLPIITTLVLETN